MIVERQFWTLSSPRCLIRQKTIFWSLFFRTTQDNMNEERQLWTCSSPLSYDKRLHFDRFPSNDTRQCDWRTTVLNFIEPKMFDRSLSYDKRLHFDRFPSNETRQFPSNDTRHFPQDNMFVERHLWTCSCPKCLISHFPSTKDYILIFLSHDTRLFEPKMCDLSLSFNKRLYFDRFSFARHKIVRAQNVWSTIFWSLFFRTTNDNLTTVVNFIEPKMFDRSLSYDKKLHFDRFPSNDTRLCDCRTTVVNLSSSICLIALFRTTKDYILIALFRTTHFDRFPSNETRQYYIRTTVVNSVDVWSLTFLQQKTTFWSLSFRTTHDNLIVERQLWTLSSPRCLIAFFRTTKDYILITFLRTTQGNMIETTVLNFIEPKMFDRSLSYDKRLHFDRFPSNETRQYYCRTTGVNLFEPKMFDRSLSYDKRLHFDRFPSNDTRQCDWRTTVVNLFEPKMCDLSLSFNKRLYFDRFSFERRTTMDNLIVERQLWTRSSPRFLISHFPTAKDYILIAFLSNDTWQFDCRTTVVNFIEPKMFDRSLSYDKRLHFDRSLSYDKRLHFDRFPSNETRQYYIRTTVVNSVEPKVFDLSLSNSKRLHFDRFPFERHTTIWL